MMKTMEPDLERQKSEERLGWNPERLDEDRAGDEGVDLRQVIGIRRILVPTDFSPPAERAVIYGLRFAEQFGAELVLLHVADPASFAPTENEAAGDFQEAVEASRRKIQEDLTGLAERFASAGEAGRNLRPRVLEVVGEPGVEIVRVAREVEADLVVIATHGYTGLGRLVMGGTTEKVVRGAGCPVLVVRENEREFVAIPG